MRSEACVCITKTMRFFFSKLGIWKPIPKFSSCPFPPQPFMDFDIKTLKKYGSTLEKRQIVLMVFEWREAERAETWVWMVKMLQLKASVCMFSRIRRLVQSACLCWTGLLDSLSVQKAGTATKATSGAKEGIQANPSHGCFRKWADMHQNFYLAEIRFHSEGLMYSEKLIFIYLNYILYIKMQSFAFQREHLIIANSKHLSSVFRWWLDHCLCQCY